MNAIIKGNTYKGYELFLGKVVIQSSSSIAAIMRWCHENEIDYIDEAD